VTEVPTTEWVRRHGQNVGETRDFHRRRPSPLAPGDWLSDWCLRCPLSRQRCQEPFISSLGR